MRRFAALALALARLRGLAEAGAAAAAGRLPEELSSMGVSALPGLSCARV